jgi:hypothetical protein
MRYKGMVLAIVALLATIVALVAGILARLAGGSYIEAVQGGGAAFAGCVTLGLMVATTLGAL